MIEIRFHGRGGQGAVIASQILVDAAFREGKDVQAFPFFGVERRGAPVTAFARISEGEIKIRSQIREPDFVVILAPTLIGLVNVTDGLKENGWILINTEKNPQDFDFKQKISTVDARGIAIKYGLGTKASPIVNTAILGAFSKISNMVSMGSVEESIREIVPSKIEENVKAAREAFERVIF
ncbi:MAG: 2-oxoacid:acceptor oxidoreductase family protein [Candidatus Methanofastidiosia archaeon]